MPYVLAMKLFINRLMMNPVNMFKILFSLLVVMLIAMPPISCVKRTETKEEFGLIDTLSRLQITMFPAWDFKDLKPPVARISLQSNTNGWFLTRALSGRYKIEFLVDNLIDTTQPAYQDLEDYLGYKSNHGLIYKQVAEVTDLEKNKIVVKLLMAEVSDIVCSLDTGRYTTYFPNRPSSIELAKTLNSVFKDVSFNYSFIKTP